MRLVGVLIVVAAMAFAAACSPQGAQAPANQADASCPDDGPRFPITGICQGRALAYFDTAPTLETHALPEGCDWTMAETAMPGEDEALLYFAARCGERATQLELRGGAQSAALGYVQSAVFDQIPDEFEPVRIFTAASLEDGKARILEFARGTTADPKEAAACEVRPANPELTPPGALVVDVTQAYRTANKLGEDGEYAVCGDYGYVSEASRYWLIKQGYAWFVDFGQDLPDVAPETLTIFKRGADGAWAPAQ